MFISERMLIKQIQMLEDCLWFLCIYLDEGMEGCTNAFICIRTQSHSFLRNHLIDVY